MNTLKIQIGGMNEEKYLTAFEEADIYVSDWAKDLISKIEFQKEKETLDVEIVTMGELGFPEGASRKDIYERAKEKGYGLLPAEVALAFRLAYKESKLYQWNLIGIEPISVSDGGQRVFFVAHDDDGLWLDGSDGGPGSMWGPGDRWVFARRKYQKLDATIFSTDLDTLTLRISSLESDMEKIKKFLII